MRRSRLLAALGATIVVAGATAMLAVTPFASAATGAALPAHVFAPYFEAYNGDSLSGLASSSGNKYLTMAFIQTASKGSCTVYWNGDTGMPISSASFGGDITTIRAGGGDVVPSFGGYAADNGGTEIADSCTNVGSIAAAYESVITTYNVTRIDLDTEDNSLTNSAGIDRRNKAIKMVEDWAAANGRTVQFVYTLPTTTAGLASTGLAVLQNAVSNNARIDIVNIMTFDYYDGASHDMATDTQQAANGLHGQLASLYPGMTSAQLWSMIGVTEMIGVDDYGPAETFTLADGPSVLNWATSQGIAELSFWALQRDNGGCPGGAAADNCSGLSQSTWQFSHVFEPFSGGTAPSPTSSNTGPSPTPTTHSPSPTSSPVSTPSAPACSAQTWNATTAYVGGTTVSYNGYVYTSKWWTQGEEPDTHSGQYDVWVNKGACSGTVGPSPTTGGSTTPPPPPPSSTVSPTSPTPTATGQYPAWAPNHAYAVGDRVSYGGHNYQCLQAHTSMVGWEPPNVPALWSYLG
jgi:chitinase